MPETLQAWLELALATPVLVQVLRHALARVGATVGGASAAWLLVAVSTALATLGAIQSGAGLDPNTIFATAGGIAASAALVYKMLVAKLLPDPAP